MMKKIYLVIIMATAMAITSCSRDGDNKQDILLETTLVQENGDVGVDRESFADKINAQESTTKESDDLSYKPNGKTPQAIINILLNDAKFTFVEMDYAEREKIALWDKVLSEYNYELAEFHDEPVEFGGYRVVDLDGDGYNEVIIDVPTTETLILHYEDNEVYGFSYPWLGIKKIYLSGIIEGATGGSRTSYSIMKFDKDSYTEINVAECNDGICYIESKEVTSDEYMKYISSDKFTGEVPYWYDYESILTTK